LMTRGRPALQAAMRRVSAPNISRSARATSLHMVGRERIRPRSEHQRRQQVRRFQQAQLRAVANATREPRT
jgi:hypothetical protein